MNRNRPLFFAIGLVATTVTASFADPAPDVISTGVLDFMITSSPGKYVVHDDAYAVTFATQPQVSAQDQATADGAQIHAATAAAGDNKVAHGFVVVPIPKTVAYSIDKGLDGARDGFFTNVHGKMSSQTAATVGGLKGRHVVGTAEVDGNHALVDMLEAWDEKHRTLLTVFTITTGTTLTAEDKAFEASLKINLKGKSPPSGDTK